MTAHFEIYAVAIVGAFTIIHFCIVVFCGPKRRKRGA